MILLLTGPLVLAQIPEEKPAQSTVTPPAAQATRHHEMTAADLQAFLDGFGPDPTGAGRYCWRDGCSREGRKGLICPGLGLFEREKTDTGDLRDRVSCGIDLEAVHMDSRYATGGARQTEPRQGCERVS